MAILSLYNAVGTFVLLLGQAACLPLLHISIHKALRLPRPQGGKPPKPWPHSSSSSMMPPVPEPRGRGNSLSSFIIDSLIEWDAQSVLADSPGRAAPG